MTDPNGGVKTLGVKLDDTLHSQFSLVAALDEISLNEAVKKAVELYVATKQQAPDFAARAKAKLDEIEREAAAKRDAIQALFGGLPVVEDASDTKTGKTTSKKGGAENA